MSEKPTEPVEADGICRRTFDVTALTVEKREEDGEDDGPSKIVGHAAVFNTETELFGFREKIEPGAFAKALETDDVRALFNHNPDLLLGRNKAGTLRLWEDSRGLGVEIDPPDTQVGRDVMESISRGDISQMSFAFRPVVEEWDDSGDTPLRTLKEVKLFDVSPVTYPAYPTTDVAARAAYDSVTPDYLIAAQRSLNASVQAKIAEGEELQRANAEAEAAQKAEVMELKRHARAKLELLR